MNKLMILAVITAGVLIGAGIYIVYDFDDTKISDDNNLNDEPFEPVNDTNGNTSFTGYTNDSVVNAMNNFSFNLYNKLFSNEENVFYSPYSVFTALAMTYEGAVGDTALDMAKVLGIPNNNETVLKTIKSLYEYLNQNDFYNISTANALWIRENFKLLESYIDTIVNYYGGEASEIDFSNPEEASEIINLWVENHTNGLIEDLVPPNAIDPFYTYLILTNAIHFKGTWETRFEVDNTTNRSFYLPDGEEIKVPTMSIVNTNNTFNYTETDELQLLELPYTGKDMSMIILLPKNGYNLSTVRNSFNNENLSSWQESFNETELDIYLPKFKIETTYGMVDYLQVLGMNKPFSDSADFSNITDEADLFISDVIHKAYIEVDEEGTEAAAATAVIMATTSVDPNQPERIEFRADQPFTFLIQQKTTGNILFMGNVINPLD